MQTKAFRSLAAAFSLLIVLAAFSSVHSQQPATPAPSSGYRIMLRSTSAPYQVSTPDEPKRKNWFVDPSVKESATFGDAGRFQAVKFEKKTAPDPRVGELDVSELTVMDLRTKKTFTLVNKKEHVVKD